MNDRSFTRAMFDCLMYAAQFDMETFGTGGLGAALAKRYFGDEGGATASELAEELPLSTAQVRRRLDGLVECGHVHRVVQDGRHVYAVTDGCAEDYADHLAKLFNKLVSLQNATGVSYTDSGR